MYIMLFIENELFPTKAVSHRQHVDAVGSRTVFSGLISVFVSDILQTCAPLTTILDRSCRSSL